MTSKTDVWFQSVYICSYFSCILWLQVTGGVMMFNPASNEPGTPVSPAQDHLYLVVGQTFQVEPFIFLQLDMVHVKKKKDADFRAFFWMCGCNAAALQIEWLLPRIGRLLPKKQKLFTKEHWICAQLHLQIFWSCVFVFQSFVGNGEAAQ